MADSPISHHEGGGASDPPPEEENATGEQQAKMEQAYAQMQRKLRITQIGEQVKRKLMVLSGKGGVGKTTVATGLALSLARRGLKVGLMDIDITGPNVPKMLGMTGHDLQVEDSQIHPAIGPHGLKVISMAFLLEDPDAAIICLCHHGMRSAQVAGFLAEQGFAKVANLSGGIDAWAVLVDESMPRY